MSGNRSNPYSGIKNEELLKIKKVLLAFSGYLSKCKTLDVVTCKAGYLLLHLYIYERGGSIEVDNISADLIVSAEELCDSIIYNFALDVLDRFGEENSHPLWESNGEEKKAISEELEPYLNLLPEYRYLERKLYQYPQQENLS